MLKIIIYTICLLISWSGSHVVANDVCCFQIYFTFLLTFANIKMPKFEIGQRLNYNLGQKFVFVYLEFSECQVIAKDN